ncbi:NADH-quinone oxidoreductase subunit H [Nocardioides panacisoli]|uniref:NADH-quinone oxidoreductase subunit H n=1 Tax=Nocardioides panacisoli TaxID=627624 RepID=UPI001C624A4F|nr:NADH-quinone oxidoreductase subunit H [Nocardioides panacisoli]QYJ05431.1 NADH-quinone oxidoreductase subunit H [Nocardioides panacisoli]
MVELVGALAAAAGVTVGCVALAWVSSVAVAYGGGRGWRLALTDPVVETARLVRQRRRRTVEADVLLWRIGGWGLLPVAVLLLALVPWGGFTALPSGHGVVWANALDVAVWALVWLLGWGANSVMGLVGGYRFLALALGYELPLMFALVAPALAAGSLDLGDIAAAQDGVWFGLWMPVALLAYLIGVVGFAVHGPLAAPAGAETAGGVMAELSGPDLLVVRLGRHALLGAGAAVAVPLFLGGGAGPVLPAAAWVALKAVGLTAGLAWCAGRLPTLRVPRLLEPLWVVLLPLVVVQDLVVAIVMEVA